MAPITLAALSIAPALSRTPETASAVLLGLVVRHLCERLELPADQLMQVLQQEVSSVRPQESELATELAWQLTVVQTVVALDAA